MDDIKKAGREVETNVKKTVRGIDGESAGDKVANTGDEMKKNLGNAGDDISGTVDIDRGPDAAPAGARQDLVDRIDNRRRPVRPGETRCAPAVFGVPAVSARQPAATIRPSRMLSTAEGSQAGGGRWVRTRVVRPAMTGSSEAQSRASVVTSRSAVASSSTRIGASLEIARAMASRRRSPPLSRMPSSPIRVAYAGGQRLDEVVDLGGVSGRPCLLVGRPTRRPAPGCRGRRVEQVTCCEHDRDHRADVVRGLAHVAPADGDRALRIARNRSRDARRSTCPRHSADDGEAAARGDGERRSSRTRWPGRLGEAERRAAGRDVVAAAHRGDGSTTGGGASISSNSRRRPPWSRRRAARLRQGPTASKPRSRPAAARRGRHRHTALADRRDPDPQQRDAAGPASAGPAPRRRGCGVAPSRRPSLERPAAAPLRCRGLIERHQVGDTLDLVDEQPRCDRARRHQVPGWRPRHGRTAAAGRRRRAPGTPPAPRPPTGRTRPAAGRERGPRPPPTVGRRPGRRGLRASRCRPRSGPGGRPSGRRRAAPGPAAPPRRRTRPEVGEYRKVPVGHDPLEVAGAARADRQYADRRDREREVGDVRRRLGAADEVGGHRDQADVGHHGDGRDRRARQEPPRPAAARARIRRSVIGPPARGRAR